MSRKSTVNDIAGTAGSGCGAGVAALHGHYYCEAGFAVYAHIWAKPAVPAELAFAGKNVAGSGIYGNSHKVTIAVTCKVRHFKVEGLLNRWHKA